MARFCKIAFLPFICSAIVWAAYVSAESNQAGQTSEAANPYSTCDSVEQMLRTMAKAKYKGHPVSKYLRPDMPNWVKQVIMAAYSLPDYSTEALQQKATNDLVNEFYIGCVEDVDSGR